MSYLIHCDEVLFTQTVTDSMKYVVCCVALHICSVVVWFLYNLCKH